MKRLDSVKLVCITILLIYASLFIIAFLGNMGNRLTSDNDVPALADGFTIESYNVFLDVEEDNKVNVTETIVVDWNELYHHGIYKFTPEWLEYTPKDGKTIKRKSIVYDYKAIDDKYSLDYVKKKARIKIGDPYQYVELGNKTYTISYVYDMGKDPYKGFDEFIFHAFGDYWGTEIKNATIEVKLPKKLDDYKINFFTDKYRENDVTKYVNYYVGDKSISASFDALRYKEEMGEELSKALTIDIALPDNYFVGGSWNYGYKSLMAISIAMLITFYVFILWYKYGKDFPKRAKTVEFYPPEDYSSAEIGYIYKQGSTKKLVVSLIVQLASKGYIKIDEDNKNITITNLVPKLKPLDSNLSGRIPKREIVMNKLRDNDGNLSRGASSLLKYLFKKGDTKHLTGKVDLFDKYRDELVSGGYLEVVSDNEEERNNPELLDLLEIEKNRYEKDKAERDRFLNSLKPLSECEQIVYDRLFEYEEVVNYKEHRTLYKAFDDVDKLLTSNLKGKIIDEAYKPKRVTAILIVIATLVLSFMAYSGFEDLDPRFFNLYYVSFACIFINIFFAIIMFRRTKYGEEIKAKVLGFRDFLDKVEKRKLEELVLENPSYFYDILPYTYVLGLSKKWIEKFENIEMPVNDMGNFNYSSDSSLSSMYYDLYRPTPTYSSSGSSGCSSCGGGCSSCGGGCSSCGGGGSW